MPRKSIKRSLGDVIKKHKEGAVIMMELPAEAYFETGSSSVKLMTKKGFDGIYISFQRPFENISSLFSDQKIDLKKVLFIDTATSLVSEVQGKNPRCIHISRDICIDDLVRAIYTFLPKLKSRKKFIFIDSLTTITLYKPLSETMRFSEFLIRAIRKDQIFLIFNVARELAQRKFIRDIALRVDEIIGV